MASDVVAIDEVVVIVVVVASFVFFQCKLLFFAGVLVLNIVLSGISNFLYSKRCRVDRSHKQEYHVWRQERDC